MTQLLEPQNTARLEHPVPQPITVEQYELLSEHGLLPENVELIRGVIVAMPPMGDEHINSLDELFKRCLFKFSNRARVTSQTPLRLKAAFGEPEPDVMLCQPDSRGVTNPEDVLLLIEISKSTYQTDRDDKLPMYAEHAIAEVWILNLLNRTLEVYLNPRQVSSGWVYDAPLVFKSGEAVAPLAFPNDLFEWWRGI
jgi:Uma2 family endonuclease